jgi:branched-chain amino acid transport system permease protein
MIAAVFTIYMILRSRLGLIIRSIREDELLAEASGLNTMKYKIVTLCISAFIAGVIGSVNCYYQSIVTPDTLSISLTFGVVAMVVVGGFGTLVGPVLGAYLLTFIAEYLYFILQFRLVIFSLLIIFIILFSPKGFLDLIIKGMESVFGLKVEEVEEWSRERTMFLKVENLTKHFGGLTAIFELKFDLSKGDILGVMGPNGAGKTTLFNLLSGFLKPNDGNIFFVGENLVGLRPHRIVQKGIARTFQQVRKFANLTVFENLKVACNYSKSPEKDLFSGSPEKKSLEILKFVNLFAKRNYVSANLPLMISSGLRLGGL